MDTIVYSFSGLAVLLLLGKYIRLKVKLFQRLFLPSSIIGGLLGLIIIQILFYKVRTDKLNEVIKIWMVTPGFLINIVFATLFLGKAIPRLKTIWNHAGVQLIYGQTVGFGQYVVGLGIVMILLVPLFKVNPMMGALIEIGFEGGHGTAAGLINTFKNLGWQEGNSLALGSATIGVFTGVIVGMILINWASRKGKTEVLEDPKNIPEDELIGIPLKEKRRKAGILTTSVESIEPMALHIAFVGLAILVGFLILQLLIFFENKVLTPTGFPVIMHSFPLFPLSMIGGVIIQIIVDKVDKKGILDYNTMQRIHGVALDFLIVAALASLSVQAIWNNIIPFLVLMIVGIAWNIFCVTVYAPMIFWNAIFERSIAEFGQSCGVTATGLVLLRVVDPEHKTPAIEAFGYKQLLHEPILGGGLFTGASLPLIHNYGPLSIFFFALGMVAFWQIFYLVVFYRKKKEYITKNKTKVE
ncbi:sodium:glutamate symporter [candidate division KSB1 bacterium]|nr:MAG: sodium:glutamate symporter [candidate division KSB1 bacterium]